MGVNIIEGAIFLEQGHRGFFTNSPYPRDVIGGISEESLVIHHLVWEDAELLFHVLGKKVFVLVGARVGKRHHDTVGDHLEQVPVSGDDFNPQAFLVGRPDGQAANHIVGFIVFHFYPRDTEEVHHLANAFNLLAQILRHFSPGGFVLPVKLMPESPAGIEGNRHVIRFLLFQDSYQHAGKAINARGGFARAGGPARVSAGCQREIRAVSDGMTVKQV